MTERPTIDASLMAIAQIWEDRSTCSRGHVGAVIALDGRTIQSGYNGAPPGMDHCQHSVSEPRMVRRVTPKGLGLPVTNYERGCQLSVHAEANAIAHAARNGVSVIGATIYTTLSPCYPCSQLIIAAGLVRVVFNRSYRDPAGIDLLRRAGVQVDHLV